MKDNEFDLIKEKILSFQPSRYWGDDFDVRYYLISEIKNLSNKKILEIGGGIGIISSELNNSNRRICLDISFEDLKVGKKLDSELNRICAHASFLPIKDNSFDIIISAHVFEYLKQEDIKISKNKNIKNFPLIQKSLKEIKNILKKDGEFFITEANNDYYKSNKLDFHELKNNLEKSFSQVDIKFFNSFWLMDKKNRKLNPANSIPKLLSKIINKKKIFKILLKSGKKKNSVSFFVKIKKD